MTFTKWGGFLDYTSDYCGYISITTTTMLEKVTTTTGSATTLQVRPGHSFGNGIIIGIVIGSVVAVTVVIGLKCCGVIACKPRNMYCQGNPCKVGSVLLTKEN